MTMTEFVTGIAELIAGANIGIWTPTGVYTPGQIAITIRATPESPDDLIVLTPYPVFDHPELNDSTIGLQIRTRGGKDPRTVDGRDDAIFDLLEGLRDVTVGGTPVVLISRQSSLPLPQDANQRWERSSNYYAQVAWPTRHRTD
ncbi:MAG: hypothetical protein QOH56_4355 [Pseudonocardiales bacterium]|jgi:hypothetical protein|nr:hypothetical protein [Pseudonocardiales bacterium]